MKTTYISLLIVLLLVSCGGNKKSGDDSLEFLTAGDSILIDESTRLTTDTTINEIKEEKKEIKFLSEEELKAYLRNSDYSGEYASGIIPLIAEKSLEYAQKLVNNTHDGFIVVDKSRMKVILFDKYGRERLSYGMACAKKYGTKHKKADSRTPEGFFTAEGIYDSTEWLFTDDDGVTSKKKGQFGPRFIRLKCPNTSQIGIHGTCAPWSIGHRVSHGCIRVTNDDIQELVKHVTVGMPIIVVPGRRDMEVNKAEGVEIPWIPTTLDYKEPKPSEAEIKRLEALKEKEEKKSEADSLIKPEVKEDKAKGDITSSRDTIHQENTVPQLQPDSI